MKRFLYGCIFVSFFFCSGSQREKASRLYATALEQVKKELEHLQITTSELSHLGEYLEFYASWYAAVTPASKELCDSLPQQALRFVERLKQLARPFEVKTDRRRLGSSKLSENGWRFYQQVIKMVQKKIAHVNRAGATD